MTFRTLTTASVFALTSATFAYADGHAGTTGYALAEDGKTLVVMASIADPAAVETFQLEQSIDALAYRPVTGDLLGYTNGAVYKINPGDGSLTDLSATYMDGAQTADASVVAFDFNNKIDAVRAVSSAGDNLVYFPDGFGDGDEKQNSVRRMTDLAWAEGDANEAVTPNVFANAYTNAIPGAKSSGTFQYALDANANALISVANNDGTLATIGFLTVGGETVDLSAMGGFDIVSPEEGTDAAYAILQFDGAETAGLYALNLETAEATLLSDLGMGGITSFAASLGQ